MRNPMAAYAQMQHVSVYAGSPIDNLIAMYERTIEHIRSAKSKLQAEDFGNAGLSIEKALRIIHEGLQICLTPGDKVSEQLMSLYVWSSDQLIKANIEKSTDGLDEAEKTLGALLGTWKELRAQKQAGK